MKQQLDTAFVRAYTELPGDLPLGARPEKEHFPPSGRVLVLDCETTIDPTQTLRFGSFQQRDNGVLLAEGFFCGPAIKPSELRTLRAWAEPRGLDVISVEEFRRELLLGWAFDGHATITGLNLPFDHSRIAVGSGESRYHMRGGFTLHMSEDPEHPRVRVKRIGPSASLIDFAQPRENQAPDSIRDQEDGLVSKRGYFVDLKTLAMALFSRSHSLASLCEFLKTETRKQETEEHGDDLTPEYIEYARTDAQATWECFERLTQIYREHGLSAGPHLIQSEASIGKAYFADMGIKPFFWHQKDEPRERLGRSQSTYFGGRAEVHIRRVPVQVAYCDFKSMYPTVLALMGLARFVTAQGYTEKDTTDETRRFLESVTADDMRGRENWRRLLTLVLIQPQDDVLPLRTKYSKDEKRSTFTIGVNRITSDIPLWYTLPDAIASKLFTGRAPKILQAVSFEPGPPQETLRPMQLFGRQEYTIDPRADVPGVDDLFVRLVNLRDEAKAKGDPIEKAIKTLTNACCYGIYAEVLRDDAPKKEPVAVYGPHGQQFELWSKAIEEPGRFFHPVLAPIITGAARLMLALAERRAAEDGVELAFCDTDSIAMARPDAMEPAEFLHRCQRVIDWFEPLNPYKKSGSILKMEDQNYRPNTKEHEPLLCYAISAKRYALFNLDKRGRPIIRKVSAHGLGLYMSPYPDDKPAKGVPKPSIPLTELGVRRWQYDRWYAILCAALAGTPDQVQHIHAALKQPAMMRYGATSPAMHRWVKALNGEKPYQDCIKPFGFLSVFTPREGAYGERADISVVDTIRAGRPRKAERVGPIAPMERDPAKAVANAVDRHTGRKVQKWELKTYAEVLSTYHMSPEDKFENGDRAHVGRTHRRHLHIKQVRLIGKEANRVDPSGAADPESVTCVEYGLQGATDTEADE